jgi:LytS/YehU family sensor histidine kinase
LELKPGENLVDIEFQALSYPTDYRMEYSYRISGLLEDWISIGQNRFVTLPSLAPGDYTFQVKAGTPLSDAPVKSLSISVATPIYLQIWFLILSAILIGALILAIMQWRIKRIRNQEVARTEVNKKIAELELTALRSQMNPHFMFNSLNSIKNYILHAEPKLAAEYLSNFSHLIRIILQNSREKSITLQEELEALTLYIQLEKLRFDDEFDFHCTIDDGLQLDHVRIPPMLLQPYVENAIWHGLMHKKEPGHLMLSFSKEGDMVDCTIDDDGVGRENARRMKSLSAIRYKSMGMGITQDRIELMNKMDALGIATTIIVKYDDAGNPTGTQVIVRIPASNGALIQ